MQSFFRVIWTALWLVTAGLVLQGGIVAQEDRHLEELDFLCEKEIEKIDAELFSAENLQARHTKENSVETMMKDENIIKEAKDSTRAQAFREMRDWDMGDSGWWIFSRPNPNPRRPWEDKRFDYQRHFRRHLREIAERYSDPKTEMADMSFEESKRLYEDKLNQINMECQRARDLYYDQQAEKAEVEAKQRADDKAKEQWEKTWEEHRIEEEKVTDAIKHEKQLIEARDNIKTQSIHREKAFEQFIGDIPVSKLDQNTITIKPGRFDPIRQQWPPPSPKKNFNSKAFSDSLANKLSKIIKIKKGDKK